MFGLRFGRTTWKSLAAGTNCTSLKAWVMLGRWEMPYFSTTLTKQLLEPFIPISNCKFPMANHPLQLPASPSNM
jgi:hypothetical protein